MQSDPTDDSPKISSPNQHPKIPSTTLQHGLQHHDAAAPVDSHGGAHHGTIAELSPDNGVGNAEPRFAGTDRYRNNNDRNSSRLSADGNQNKARRILYDGSVDFGPTPGDKVSHDGGLETGYEARILHVTDLPNEVLTHALSHLAPADLSSTALVSRRFHSLVTTPDAWRSAFARFFPGPAALKSTADKPSKFQDSKELFRSDRRSFCRLTALASWRSEYIVRARLLRSLAKGRPVLSSIGSGSSPRGSTSHSLSPVIMYNSQLFSAINHIHTSFGRGPGKRLSSVIHGTDHLGTSTASDPNSGKVDNWGMADPQLFKHFADHYVGDPIWGLGSGEVVGNPNVMDVSQPYGMVYGEGLPNGRTYYRSIDEARGRYLQDTIWTRDHLPEDGPGVPKVPYLREGICSVCVAKTSSIPSLSEGMVGMFFGSSLGIVSAFSLGYPGMRDRSLSRGELTARWVLSPGVPIVALTVDDAYSLKRQAQNRIWAVALNALGEVFYLTKFPKRSTPGARLSHPIDEKTRECLAWDSGRTVYWNLVEPSRRVARPDPYDESPVDGSYSPRSSWDGMCLSDAQVRAETAEIEKFLNMRPKHMQKLCLGWDMRRRLEADFAGDDGNFAGEGVAVFNCGLEEDTKAEVKRFVRCKIRARSEHREYASGISTPRVPGTTTYTVSSIFGGDQDSRTSPNETSVDGRGRTVSPKRFASVGPSPERVQSVEEWRTSVLSLWTPKSVQITATTLDISTFATSTLSEDPLVTVSGGSETSSGSSSSSPVSTSDSTPKTVMPGQRSRFVAAGTNTGSVYIWDMRASIPTTLNFVQPIDPIRIIYTESPEISSLAMTALYIVHGGNDGLVQAWDPLASQMEPIRTLNSRFSTRARRRLVQAQASPQGVGINMFAAGAVVLDPDPSMLRGIVTLGNQLRYWSYRSGELDVGDKGRKRKLRKGSRGSNTNNGTPGGVLRNAGLRSYIEDEWSDMKVEEQRANKERQRLIRRFGVGWLGEEEGLRLAMALSEETFSKSQSENSTPKPEARTARQTFDDSEVAEAIRRSLEEADDANSPSPKNSASSSPSPALWDVPIRVAKRGNGSSKSGSRSPKSLAGPSHIGGMDDIELAILLSMEDQGGVAEESNDYPALHGDSPGGKGKTRAT